MYTQKALTRALSTFGAIVVCTLAATDVEAKDKEVTVAYQVTTQGLDLSRPSGAQTLYSRLEHAAKVVCTHGMRVDLKPAVDFAGCYEKALGRAVRSANLPLLTQVYRDAHTPSSVFASGIDLQVQIAAK